ncbi:MAG: hypothetical protein C5B50_04385 [Verrucomicrobia bacterium]|nr:MAG: hypothetical protein C5B50_04385 [Verrucomicrobiota bacterium]
MTEATTIKFKDQESGDEAIAIVRYDDSSVGLSLSLASNGDVEVFMPKPIARALIKELAKAAE